MTMTWVPVKNIKALRRYLAQQRKLLCEYALNINVKTLVREFKSLRRRIPERHRKKSLMLLTLSLEEAEVLNRDQCQLVAQLVVSEMSRFASIPGTNGPEQYNCDQLKSWWPWHGDTANQHCQAVICMLDVLSGKHVSLNAINGYRDITAMHSVVRSVEAKLGLHCHENNPRPEISLDPITGLWSAELRGYERKSKLSITAAKVVAHRGRPAAEKLAHILETTCSAMILEEAKKRYLAPWIWFGEVLKQHNACFRAWGRGYSFAIDGQPVPASELTRHRQKLAGWKYDRLVEQFGKPAGWELLGMPLEEQKTRMAHDNSVAHRLPAIARWINEREKESVKFIVERAFCRLPAEEAYLQAVDWEGKVRHRSKVSIKAIRLELEEMLRWEQAGYNVSVCPISPANHQIIGLYGLSAEAKDQLVQSLAPSSVFKTDPNEFALLLAAENPSGDPVENKIALRAWGHELALKYHGRTDLVAEDGFPVPGLARTATDGFIPRLVQSTYALHPQVTHALAKAHAQCQEREKEFWRGKAGEALNIIVKLKLIGDERAFSLEAELCAAHLERIAAAAQVCLTIHDRDERIARGLLRGGETAEKARAIMTTVLPLITPTTEVLNLPTRIDACIKNAAKYIARAGIDDELVRIHQALKTKAEARTKKRAAKRRKEMEDLKAFRKEKEMRIFEESVERTENQLKSLTEKKTKSRREFNQAEEATMAAEWTLAEEIVASTRRDEKAERRHEYNQWITGAVLMPQFLSPLLDVNREESVQRARAKQAIIAQYDENEARDWAWLISDLETNHNHHDRLLHHAVELERKRIAGELSMEQVSARQREYVRELHVLDRMQMPTDLKQEKTR